MQSKNLQKSNDKIRLKYVKSLGKAFYLNKGESKRDIRDAETYIEKTRGIYFPSECPRDRTQ